VLFLATSGEEHGLLGSTWFSNNPTVFLSDAIALINLDMVGRNDPNHIGVVGWGYSSLGPLVEAVAAEHPHLGLEIIRDPSPEENLFQRSDHWPFARRGIPAIELFSLLHDDYHSPDDETRRVDPGKAARVARLAFLTAYRLATEPITPEWNEEGRRAIRQ
jgi:hypothetical protein